MKKLSFGFCFYSSKRGLKDCEKCENVLLENNIEFERNDRMYKFKEIFSNEDLLNDKINSVRNLMLENDIIKYVIFNNEK
jgi:hypothetical protein